MTAFTATYSPDDNKLRLYATTRLDALTYAKVKAAGFRWAPRQELFVAPCWTPEREDLLLGLAGEIDDDDTSLVDRAEERAERFGEYSEKRLSDAQAAHDAVGRIANGIPLGQPILVGHHSERHARKDAERIENGMRKAIKLWETSEYWTARAAGALRHAKYKELPQVRHRRIKKLEGEKRGFERQLAKAAPESLWKVKCERWINHLENRIAYERAMLNEQIGTGETGEGIAGRFDMKVGGKVLVGGEWLVILRVNKAGGAVNSVTTIAPRAVTWTNKWKYSVEEVGDYQAPTETMAAKVKKATSLPPLCNYPGEGFREMTQAEWAARHKWSDFPYVGTIKATETAGKHRVRQMPGHPHWNKVQVFLTDAKRVDPPKPEPTDPVPIAPEPARPTMRDMTANVKHKDETGAPFEALKASLKAGVTVVTAPTLFVTPPAVTERAIELADPGPTLTLMEPSAGTGELVAAAAVHIQPQNITAIEVNLGLAAGPRSRFPTVDIIPKDFLTVTADELGLFDRVIMNPPFDNGADIKHIEHAMTFMKPGGVLVAICAGGPRQERAFRPRAERWEELPPGTFSGTQVRSYLMVIRK